MGTTIKVALPAGGAGGQQTKVLAHALAMRALDDGGEVIGPAALMLAYCSLARALGLDLEVVVSALREQWSTCGGPPRTGG